VEKDNGGGIENSVKTGAKPEVVVGCGGVSSAVRVLAQEI